MALYLITGGAGFIGLHIVEALLQRGERVRVLDNFSTGCRANLQHTNNIDIVEGDVRDVEAVRRSVRGVDYVIHHAAFVSVPKSMTEPAITHDVNVTGTLNLLRAAQQMEVKRFVLASSSAVYGDSTDLPLSETAITRPLSPYAASKLIGEIYCQTFFQAYGTPTTCLRYFNVFGPRQNPDGDYAAVIPKFARRMATGQAPIIYGDGQQTRDFVYVADVVKANLRACKDPAAVGEIFNVASGYGVSLLELVETINQLRGSQIRPVFARPRDGDIKHSRGDASKLTARLGLRIDTPFGQHLADVLPSF